MTATATKTTPLADPANDKEEGKQTATGNQKQTTEIAANTAPAKAPCVINRVLLLVTAAPMYPAKKQMIAMAMTQLRLATNNKHIVACVVCIKFILVAVSMPIAVTNIDTSYLRTIKRYITKLITNAAMGHFGYYLSLLVLTISITCCIVSCKKINTF